MDALLTGLAQSAVSIAAGVNAVLVGARHPASDQTDGLFTAFAVYGLVVTISASSRTALVPHLIDKQRSFSGFNSMLAALLWATPVIGLIFAIAMPPAITAFTGDGSSGIVSTTLLILWPAAVGQFVAALGAAILGVLEDFHSAAFGYGFGGAVSVASFLALEPIIGLEALPVAVLIGTILMVAVVLTALMKRGWRPSELSLRPRGAWRWNKILLTGAAYYIFGQSLYLVSVAIAARTVGEGAATLYAYGYFAIGLVVAFAGAGAGLVLAAPVASDWDNDPKSLAPIENDSIRTSLLLLAFFVPAVAMLGDDIAARVLISFEATDIEQIIDVIITLTPLAIAIQLVVVPLLALFARKQLGVAALVGAASLVAQVGITYALGTLGDLVWIAVAASLTQTLQAILLISLIHRREAIRRIIATMRDIALIAIPALVAYGGANRAATAAGIDGLPHDAAAFLIGSGVLAAALLLLIPTYRDFIRGVGGSLLGDARRFAR